MIVASRLSGPLIVPALEQALNEIRRRHAVLRTNYHLVNEQLVQTIAPHHPETLEVTDLSNLPIDQRGSACDRWITSRGRIPFNLKSDPLIRAGLLRLRSEEHVLLLVMHHIASDGWSLQVLNTEMSALYDAFAQGKPSPLPDLPIQYADYAVWQRGFLRGKVLEDQLGYWKKHLGGDLPVLDLPTDRARPIMQSFNGARLTVMVPGSLAKSLTTLSQRHQATLFMTMMSAFTTLLHRLTGQEDIIIGTPIAGRTRIETEKLIGLFLNTLALRTDLSGKPTFAEVLKRVRGVTLDALTHQELPFEKLVEELHPERSLGHSPLFQVLLNMFMMEQTTLKLTGLKAEQIPTPESESKFDLTLYIRPSDQQLQLDLVFNIDLFDTARMEELLVQFTRLLEQIVAAPDQPIQAYSLVTERSRTLLPDPRATLDEPIHAPVVSDFLRWAKQTPSQKAVIQLGRSWTYEELASSALGIAHTLVSHGLQRGDVVTVTGSRNFGLIACAVGVFMSGGVMLTIDRNLPANRQRLMLDVARAKYLLYVGEWRVEDDWLREIADLKIIAVAKQECTRTADDMGTLPEVSPDDPAYLFFTSGTTGVPKGVLGCHKGLSHFLAWQRSTFDIGPRDRCAQLTNLSFDVVLRDIFLPLTSGATLCLPDETADPASDGTVSWLDRQSITLLHVVPTVAQTWLGHRLDGVTLHKLRWTFFAGEALTETLVRRWRDAFPETGEIVNLYGPTETTLVKCFHVVPGEPWTGIQPVGKPLPQSQALVLSETGQPCGVGEPGEIVIRTPFRTLGYVNAPEEQQKRFVKNPFRDDPRDLVYFTGDRGRYRADGVLEILGRSDDQVKVRGVRVEPGEITAILARDARVKACFVAAHKDHQGDNFLVAYVVPFTPDAVAAGDLRSHLGAHLPAAMVPTAFVFLDALPMTPNGKVNRRALPEPDLSSREKTSTFVAPRTPTEQSLADIWCRVLKRKTVGMCDNFFDLGGHSLIATQLVSQIRREFNAELPLRAIFEKPTIEGLALHILELQTKETGVGNIEQLLNEVESLSDETAENQLSALKTDAAPGEPSATGFRCPTARSPLFGKRECNLIIVINERFELASFERIAGMVRELDPTINAVVVRDALPMSIQLPPRPTFTFSPAAIRHQPPRAGQVFAGYPLSKSEEYRALEKCGVPVPKWVVVTEEETPDLSGFGEYVVRKPDYGGMSAEVLIVRKDRVKWKPITTRAAGTSESMIVQQFIYTGLRPVSYRVQTLFGRVLYSIKQQASEDRPPLDSPDILPSAVSQKGFSISATARGGLTELNFDEEIIRLAERAHTAFPDIPLLGFDIIREAPSGKVYVLEANAIGYTWNFTSDQLANYGFSFEEQFDGARKAAYVLAERTQQYAR